MFNSHDDPFKIQPICDITPRGQTGPLMPYSYAILHTWARHDFFFIVLLFLLNMSECMRRLVQLFNNYDNHPSLSRKDIENIKTTRIPDLVFKKTKSSEVLSFTWL